MNLHRNGNVPPHMSTCSQGRMQRLICRQQQRVGNQCGHGCSGIVAGTRMKSVQPWSLSRPSVHHAAPPLTNMMKGCLTMMQNEQIHHHIKEHLVFCHDKVLLHSWQNPTFQQHSHMCRSQMCTATLEIGCVRQCCHVVMQASIGNSKHMTEPI